MIELMNCEAEREKVEKLRALVTELQIQFSKGFYTPMHEMDRQRLMAELSAEREASRKLVELLKKGVGRHYQDCTMGGSAWNGGDYCSCDAAERREALKFYATPQASWSWPLQGGHSPEGKDVA